MENPKADLIRVCIYRKGRRIVTEKKAIVAVSFGTTVDEARDAAITPIEREWAEAFPDYIVRSAFTSSIVRRRLAERGIFIDSVEEALSALLAEGVQKVYLQPTHLIPGEEYDLLREAAEKWQKKFALLKIGEPLLADRKDMERVLCRMKERFPVKEGTVCIFMGHGSAHAANRVYEQLAGILSQEEGQSYFMATVEGSPSFLDALLAVEKRSGISKIILVPFMLVAGDHARNDMSGEDAESWKSICEAKGYETECHLQGMGEYPEIRALYQEKCRKCLRGSFYAISVGPGMGGALTLDGAERIKNCQVLAIPRTKGSHSLALSIVQKANEQLKEMFGCEDYLLLSQKEILYLDFQMTKDIEKREQTHAEHLQKLMSYLERGIDVGMAVLGDVSIYATSAPLLQALKEKGYKTGMLAGVTSFSAAAAALEISLTKTAKPLHIIPAGYEGLMEALRLPGSKVLMKSGKKLPEIKKLLKELALYDSTHLVRDCGLATQEVCQNLDEDTDRDSYFTTLFVPGETECM